MTQPDSRDVERVARGIACVRHGGEPNEEMADFMWIAYADDARAALATTGTRVTELEAALRAIVDACANTGSGNAIVAERVIDRCDDFARAALDR